MTYLLFNVKFSSFRLFWIIEKNWKKYIFTFVGAMATFLWETHTQQIHFRPLFPSGANMFTVFGDPITRTLYRWNHLNMKSIIHKNKKVGASGIKHHIVATTQQVNTKQINKQTACSLRSMLWTRSSFRTRVRK